MLCIFHLWREHDSDENRLCATIMHFTVYWNMKPALNIAVHVFTGLGSGDGPPSRLDGHVWAAALHAPRAADGAAAGDGRGHLRSDAAIRPPLQRRLRCGICAYKKCTPPVPRKAPYMIYPTWCGMILLPGFMPLCRASSHQHNFTTVDMCGNCGMIIWPAIVPLAEAYAYRRWSRCTGWAIYSLWEPVFAYKVFCDFEAPARQHVFLVGRSSRSQHLHLSARKPILTIHSSVLTHHSSYCLHFLCIFGLSFEATAWETLLPVDISAIHPPLILLGFTH